MNFKVLVAAVILCGAFEASAVTREQCQHEFNKCKKDVKNLFNQNKCKKARNQCESTAATEAAQANTKANMLGGFQQNNIKDQMMNGTAGQGNSMKNNMMAGGQQPTAVDPKEAARLRMLEREKAQNQNITK